MAERAWPEILHEAVRAMATDDRDLGFMSSLLASALKYDGLTDRQAKYANRILDRMRDTSVTLQPATARQRTPRPALGGE